MSERYRIELPLMAHLISLILINGFNRDSVRFFNAGFRSSVNRLKWNPRNHMPSNNGSSTWLDTLTLLIVTLSCRLACRILLTLMEVLICPKIWFYTAAIDAGAFPHDGMANTLENGICYTAPSYIMALAPLTYPASSTNHYFKLYTATKKLLMPLRAELTKPFLQGWAEPMPIRAVRF